MTLDVLRLALGLGLACFHRPVADFILSQEHALAGLFRVRGIPVPAPPTTETLRTLYFSLGIFLALVAMARIWWSLHPDNQLAALLLR
jgi:hypothetical protein